MIYVIATLTIHPEKRADFLENAPHGHRRDPQGAGCLTYDLTSSITEPNQFVFIERWETRENLAAHFETPHLAEWRRLCEICREPRGRGHRSAECGSPLGAARPLERAMTDAAAVRNHPGLYDEDFYRLGQGQRACCASGASKTLISKISTDEVDGVGRSEKREIRNRLAVLSDPPSEMEVSAGQSDILWRHHPQPAPERGPCLAIAPASAAIPRRFSAKLRPAASAPRAKPASTSRCFPKRPLSPSIRRSTRPSCRGSPIVTIPPFSRPEHS